MVINNKIVGNTEKSVGSLTYKDKSNITIHTDMLIISKKSISQGTGGKITINNIVKISIAIIISGRFKINHLFAIYC